MKEKLGSCTDRRRSFFPEKELHFSRRNDQDSSKGIHFYDKHNFLRKPTGFSSKKFFEKRSVSGKDIIKH